MKKIIFLSGEDLLDVDMPIVKEIHKNFQFTWCIILKGYGWFNRANLENFCNENKISYIIRVQNSKLKNPRTLIFHIKLLALLRRLDADLIYDSYLGVPYLHFFSSIFVPRNKFVIAIHDVIQHHKMGSRNIRAFYYDYVMKAFDNIHLFSKSQHDIFMKKYYNKNILLAPLVLKNFGGEKISKTKTGNGWNFLFFGIIRENKGVDLLIQAANQLSKNNPNMTITIAGKSAGSCWEKYEKLIENKDIFDLQIKTIPNENVSDLMNTADFLILPYRDVTQSGVLLAAYNYQLPVIATNLKGFNEYITHSKTGFLFENESVESLRNIMQLAMQLSIDEYNDMTNSLKHFIDAEINTLGISKKYVEYFNQTLYR